ncbi:fluoride efflux transporter FluC [Natronomonas marina]|uniref:fluoride efflux transporter FluC n=1 Tax=Natronomonas marina TaxID=2961939 RepID=UPI0020C978AC|nr:CrcB family protein [Natronomonas marina]
MERRVVLLVGAGGFAGAVCRHAVSVALSAGFPWGTLAVNVAGAFLLGLFVYGSAELRRVPESARLVVSAGFLSSFTTYSAFAAETVALAPALAAGNVFANYALGLGAVVAARGVVLWRS